MNAINYELPRIQEQVYYGHIQSHTDILDKFLAESSYKRYNPSVSTNISVKCGTLIFSQLIMPPLSSSDCWKEHSEKEICFTICIVSSERFCI
jgi:hypothetical protein